MIDQVKVDSIFSGLCVESQGFYGITKLTDVDIGWGFWKDFPSKQSGSSLFHFLIENVHWRDDGLLRKPVVITVVYGEKTRANDGVKIRKDRALDEPIDLNFIGDYLYDISTGSYYRKGKRIEGRAILDEVYRKHTRPTRPVAGLYIRSKLWLWWRLLPSVFRLLAGAFHQCLFVISGDRYTYEFYLGEEELNGDIISSSLEGRVGRRKDQLKSIEKQGEAKKFNLFGIIEVPQWPIVFYSVLHLIFWFILKYKGESEYSTVITDLFNSNFFGILYVVVSFWLLETIVPYTLKKLIRYTSTVGARCSHRLLHV